ncbi:serine/threonine-protein kinase Sgk2 [Blumeria hordei DH14]|uniref:Serine/threonine-protein kinase Sgk2 n=1 Tax=Blumeria graminis f. sp. hordei (strain DH14) TaxID=546991 RepID=N1J9T9_BLUG1|nr:serine/threonine-protein kinase Sgk2 [Blumeria hordei DH14]
MSQFPEIYAYLNKNPIEAILTSFRKNYTEDTAQNDVCNLLLTLSHHTIHNTLNEELIKLQDDFLSIRAKIRKHKSYLTNIKSLVQAVLQNQDEAEVFKIAIDLVQKLSDEPSDNQPSGRKVLTPTNGPFSFTRSISEAVGLHKTVVCITAALENELHDNVIVNLDNFWTKLFLDKIWSKQTLNIWESYLAYELKEAKFQIEDTIKEKKAYALFLQQEAENQKQVENTKDKPRETQVSKLGKVATLAETGKNARSYKNQIARNPKTVMEEEEPKTYRKTRSQTKKEEDEKAISAENEALASSQDTFNINSNDSQDKPNLTEYENVRMPKIVYANKILTKDMTEDEMWDWLDFFRENFLNQLTDHFSNPSEKFPSIIKEELGSELRCHYFRSSDECPMTGTDNNCQADLITKRMEFSNVHTQKHQWSDVRALGEFSKNSSKNKRKARFLQLSRLALEVFYTQPLRHFVHGFCVFESSFELWVFNRSGAFSSGLFDLEKDKEKLVRAICSYLLMSDQELGMDSSIRQVDGRSFVSIDDKKLKKRTEFEINPNSFFRVRTLASRGTTCFETSDESKVVKYSWFRIPGKSEIDFLYHANGIEGVVEYVSADVICTIGDHLGELNFSNASFWKISGSDPYFSTAEDAEEAEEAEESKTPQLKDRELRRIVITPRGHSLRSCKTIMQFLVVIRDAIVAYRRLYVEKKILHGDISDGNIILAKVGGQIQGVLIDLDHAEMVGPPHDPNDNFSLIGTMKFMALERLQHASNSKPTINRTFHHDLESFFYVFIVGCITYEREEDSKEVIDLQKWFTGTISEIFDAKLLAVLSFRIKILANFSTSFQCLRPLATELREILFGEYGDEYYTPEEREPEYEKIIKAFNNTIEDVRGKINE